MVKGLSLRDLKYKEKNQIKKTKPVKLRDIYQNATHS